MFAAASVAVLVTLSLVLVRAALGPTVFDRVQAANTVGTCALMLLALIGFLTGRPEFLEPYWSGIGAQDAAVVALDDDRLVFGFEALAAARAGAPLTRSFKRVLAAPDVTAETPVTVVSTPSGKAASTPSAPTAASGPRR